MPKYIEEARQARETVNEITQRATGNIRTFQKMYDELKVEIENDGLLSPEGKEKKREELNEKMGRQLMETLATERDEFEKAVVKAQNNAQRALIEPLEKPHEMDVALHDREVTQLKLDAVFLSGREVVNKLTTYAETIDNPYLAEQLVKELPGIADRVSGSSTITSADMSKLRSVYTSLQQKALTPDKREAKQILESMNGRFSTKLYQGLHEDAIKSRLGVGYSRYLNEPQLKLKTLVDSD
ncbi:hypothetical protein [Halalkalibacter oceani]|uniref:hypothetical protein n=1 Tax=Halalkalibacter oceani TaxID=1653776 RepID=UPI003398768D